MASKISSWRERKALPLVEKLIAKSGLTLDCLRSPTKAKAPVLARRAVARVLFAAGFTNTEIGGFLNRDHTSVSSMLDNKMARDASAASPERAQTISDVIESVRICEGHTVSRKAALLLAEEIERLRGYEDRLMTGNLARLVQQQNRQQALLRTYDAMFSAFQGAFGRLEASRLGIASRQNVAGASHMLQAVIGDTPDDKYRRELEERVQRLLGGDSVSFLEAAE